MRRLLPKSVRRFLPAERGATAIEYALIAAGIAGVLVAVIGTLGGAVNSLWTSVSNAFH